MKTLILFVALLASASGQVINNGGGAASGSSGYTVTQKTASYLLTCSDFGTGFIAFAQTTTGVVATLPATACTAGKAVTITNQSIYEMTVDPNGNQLGGFSFIVNLDAGASITVVSDGTNYRITNTSSGLAGHISRHYWREFPSDGIFNAFADFESTTIARCDGSCNQFVASPTTGLPPNWQLTTSAANPSVAWTFITQGDTCFGNAAHPCNPYWGGWVWLDTANATNKIVWAGMAGGNGESMVTQFATGNLSKITDGANPGGGLAFRLSGPDGDTTWQCINSNGTSQTQTSTGLTLDTNPHFFEVLADDTNGKSLFKVDGVVVCGPHSNTNYPLAGQTPFLGVGIETRTTTIMKLNTGPQLAADNN